MSNILMQDLINIHNKEKDLGYRKYILEQEFREIEEEYDKLLQESTRQSKDFLEKLKTGNIKNIKENNIGERILANTERIEKHKKIKQQLIKDSSVLYADLLTYLIDFFEDKERIKHKKYWVSLNNKEKLSSFYNVVPIFKTDVHESLMVYNFEKNTKVLDKLVNLYEQRESSFLDLNNSLNYSRLFLNENNIEIARYKTVSKKEIKNIKNMVFNIKFTYCKCTEKGYTTKNVYCCSEDGIKWFHSDTLKKIDLNFSNIFNHFSEQYYFWYINIGTRNSPKFAMKVNTESVKSVFRLRDIPPGEKRRKALHTWVSEHTRHIKDQKFDQTYVRKHLRGELTFNWNGLYCRIIPSQHDIDLNKEYAHKRKIAVGL